MLINVIPVPLDITIIQEYARYVIPHVVYAPLRQFVADVRLDPFFLRINVVLMEHLHVFLMQSAQAVMITTSFLLQPVPSVETIVKHVLLKLLVLSA